MPPLSPQRRDAANAVEVRSPDLPEGAHFHRCAICGQSVDRRKLGDVIYHEARAHQPLRDALPQAAGGPFRLANGWKNSD